MAILDSPRLGHKLGERRGWPAVTYVTAPRLEIRRGFRVGTTAAVRIYLYGGSKKGIEVLRHERNCHGANNLATMEALPEGLKVPLGLERPAAIAAAEF